MLSQSDLIIRYRELRETAKKMGSAVVSQLPTDALKEGARDLGMLRNGTFVFNNESETCVLMDYCIYNLSRRGRNAVQSRLAENPPPEGSDDLLVLNAMSKAWFSLFSVESVEPDFGLRVRDAIRQTEHLLIDINFSKCARQGDILATRVISFDNFVISSGAGLPMGSGVEGAEERLHKFLFDMNIPSPSQLTPEQERRLARGIILAAGSRGDSSRIRYEDPGYQGPSVPRGRFERERPVSVQAGGKIGRNERCPCGSGMKYKNCCGR